MAQQMRRAGASEVKARQYDNRVRTSLALATVGTVVEVRVKARLVLLTSDGVHDVLDHKRLTELTRRHAKNPQTLAATLVSEAVTAAHDGEDQQDVDNASAVVLLLT